ncbi:MAG: CPXCG motif-containing cysteine-rich protein [Proteobacteria bacterium]|nr:MAG: CPXCG motif-containing cysteine-rich protein [Pseudomonadota bacterium]
MEEIEKFFKCPYCHQKISMVLDVSVDGTQVYIEDCEVCCRPIQLTYSVNDGQMTNFSREGAG